MIMPLLLCYHGDHTLAVCKELHKLSQMCCRDSLDSSEGEVASGLYAVYGRQPTLDVGLSLENSKVEGF